MNVAVKKTAASSGDNVALHCPSFPYNLSCPRLSSSTDLKVRSAVDGPPEPHGAATPPGRVWGPPLILSHTQEHCCHSALEQGVQSERLYANTDIKMELLDVYNLSSCELRVLRQLPAVEEENSALQLARPHSESVLSSGSGTNTSTLRLQHTELQEELTPAWYRQSAGLATLCVGGEGAQRGSETFRTSGSRRGVCET
ncbi:hypothetical protein EYF80_029402 [Liparis tanakae]|uniref:Uncharacterized protein n=1 Tax=Liparis tanakae TaxID=230148 RepID=A0A4Z2H5U0_9TELE|nr:hypothetical protein EYF80_029402 [Liparis tanakae]